MKVDLHIHTNKSDGRQSFEDVLNEARNLDINTIAITDHDVLNNALEKENINIITGIELSAVYNNGLFHILGYHIDNQNKHLVEVVQKNITAEASHSRFKDNVFIEEYSKKFEFDIDNYREYPIEAMPIPGQQFRSKAHDYLIEKKYCKDRKDFFMRIMPEVFPHRIGWGYPNFISLEEAIRTIRFSKIIH